MRAVLVGMLWLAGLCVADARAALTHDPALAWKTLRTSHFLIHYHDGLEAWARATAALAEATHARLAPPFAWQPDGPTEIVLTDEQDVSNGFAIPFPDNRITLYLAPPDSPDSLEDHAGWLEAVIEHEYVHTLHLDKARDVPLTLRSVFGRVPLFFPNALEPAWLIEGIATYYETDHARGVGRGQSSFFDMLMRAEVEGGIKPLAQVNQRVDTWPAGHAPYLYGVFFYQYLADTYGADAVQRWVQHYSSNLIPYRIITNAERTVGKDIDALWSEFSAALVRRHDTELAAMRAAGVHAGEQLTREGYALGSARAAPDGGAYFVTDNGREPPALKRLRPGVGAAQRLARVRSGARIDVHPVQGVLVIQPEVCRNTRLHYDLYRIDGDGGALERLTHCARYRSAAWHPSGARIAALHYAGGESRLELLDERARPVEVLWQGTDGVVVTDLAWSPDGAALAAAVWRRESGWNIELFSLAARRWRALTDDSAIDLHPQFSADGAAVVFSSDSGGVYNIRRLALADGTVATLTQVTGGAFQPSVAPNGDLYYLGHRPGGFDLYRVAAADLPRLPTPIAAAGPSGVARPVPPPPALAEAQDYSPVDGLRPRWWLPHLALDTTRTEIGATTSGSDALERHVYLLDAAYDFANDTAVGSIDYLYDRWFPALRLNAARATVLETVSSDGATDVVRVRHADTLAGEIILPWVRYDYSWSLNLGLVRDRESDAWRADGVAPRADSRDDLAGLALVFSSTRRYPLSISRAYGRDVRLVAESSDLVGASDYRGEVYTLDWREFFALGAEHVLAARFVEGYGTDDPRPFQLGGSAGAAPALPLLGEVLAGSPFNRRVYPLRGYPEGLAALAGRRMRLASLEWRFPIARTERGIMTPPLALHQWSGTLFADSGGAWQEGGAPSAYRSGAGLELNFDSALFYSLRFNLRLGYAHGFDAGGEDQVYLRIGVPF